MLPLLALAVLLAPAPAAAFWRLPCNYPVSVQRLDPIVNPAGVSGHVHTVMGGNGFDATMDYPKARNSSCSTCTVKEDLSSYWTPNLWFAAENGSFHPVAQAGGMLVYYLQRYSSDGPEPLTAFPPGFRMLAGDPFLRSFNATPAQDAISFACLDYDNPSPETPALPDRNCKDGLRAQVFFPSCWDGKNLDSADHKSHMAYPDPEDAGRCPETHPSRMVSLFYEVIFDVDAWKDEWYNASQPFVFSNGDPTGYGFHGDFLNGWHIPTLQSAITNCTAASGAIEQCPYFTYFPAAATEDCFTPPRVAERVDGWLPRLPGCNPIQRGPKRAVPQTGCGATTVVGKPKVYYEDLTARGWRYEGCAMDKRGDRTFPETTASDDMTVEHCIDRCEEDGYKYAGLEYARECWCGNTIHQARLGLVKCVTPCAGNETQYCGGSLKLTVYKKT